MSTTPQMEGEQVRFVPDQYNWERMMGVVHKMRKIPELPSEKPKDTSHLLEVRFPEEGGVLTFMSGQDEAYKGFPFHEMVDKIDMLKKVIRSTLSSFFHSIKRRNKLQLITVALVPWLLKDLARAGIYTFFRIVERFEIKENMYSTSMRELFRAMSIEFDGEEEHERELRSQLKVLVCMTLEFDNAYRFRFQDIMGELDKKALKKDAGKELNRLLTLMQTREKEQQVSDTWKLFKTFIPVVLLFNGQLRKRVVSILSELDLQKVSLSREDKNYCAPRKDYMFGFQLNPSEDDKKLIFRITRKKEIEELQASVRNESTQAHEKLFARQKSEMNVPAEIEAKIVEETNNYLAQCNIEGNQKFEVGRKEILRKYLNEDQLKLIDKHNQEREQMDKEFNSKLEHVSN